MKRPIRLNALISPLLICAAIGAGPVGAASLYSQGSHEIGSIGYIRAGTGTSDDDTQVCFQAPGAGAKYRLGNECEVYAKASLYYRYRFDQNQDAPYLHLEIKPEFTGAYGDPIKHTEEIEKYIEFGNIGHTPIKVWAGRRQYFRRDIHINDFFYMNTRGDGLGVRDIPVGPGALHYTYLTRSDIPTGVAGAGEVDLYNHELSLTGVETNPGGALGADLRLARIDGGSFANGTVTQHGADGWSLNLQHSQKGILGGTNTLAAQYGQGAGRSAWSSPHESPAALGRLTTPAAADALEDAKTWRLIDHHLYEGDQWAMMSSLLWEDKNSTAFDGTDQTWISVGARPTWFLDDHWRLTSELGWDYVDDHTAQSDGHLRKLTLAVEWAPERRFFSRPALRAYVTHAAWSNSFVGQVGGPTFANQDNGWNAGVQLEAWW